MPLNPFDWLGPPFLLLYTGLLLMVGVASQRARSTANPNARFPQELSPLEFAFLAGGRRKAVDTALLLLLSAGAATLSARPATLLQRRVIIDGEAAAKIIDNYPSRESGALSRARFTRAMTLKLAQLASSLAERGFLLTSREAFHARLETLSLLGALTLFGLTKIGVGVSRGRPVGFLVILVIATLVIAVGAGLRSAWRTSAGAAALAEGRRRHRRAARAPLSSELALAFALTGPAVLAGTPYAAYGTWLRGSGADSGGDGGSACGGGGGCGGCSG